MCDSWLYYKYNSIEHSCNSHLQLYQDLNIRVVLVDVTTWTNGDQINVVSDPDQLLDNFALYKRQITARFDSAMLIT